MAEAMEEFSREVGKIAGDDTVGSIVQDRLFAIFMLGVEFGFKSGEKGMNLEMTLTQARQKWTEE